MADCTATEKSWSRPVSRVLSRTIIPLGPPSPVGSSNLPGSCAGRANGTLFGLAPSGVCRTGLLPDSWCALTAPFHPCHALHSAFRRCGNTVSSLRTTSAPQHGGVRRSALCCTVRRLAPPRRYLALCPVEPGLSSPTASSGSDRPADSAAEITQDHARTQGKDMEKTRPSDHPFNASARSYKAFFFMPVIPAASAAACLTGNSASRMPSTRSASCQSCSPAASGAPSSTSTISPRC